MSELNNDTLSEKNVEFFVYNCKNLIKKRRIDKSIVTKRIIKEKKNITNLIIKDGRHWVPLFLNLNYIHFLDLISNIILINCFLGNFLVNLKSLMTKYLFSDKHLSHENKAKN